VFLFGCSGRVDGTDQREVPARRDFTDLRSSERAKQAFSGPESDYYFPGNGSSSAAPSLDGS